MIIWVGGTYVCISPDRLLISPLLAATRALMSNGNSPHVRHADSGFMTMVLDPDQPMSCSAQLEGGTMMFMSPELLVPSKFDITESIPTPETDIFSFGSAIHQVCDHDRGHPPFTYIFQALTGKLPFPGLGMAEIALNAVRLWGGVMLACAQVSCIVSTVPNPVSDSMAHCKLWIPNNLAGSMDAVPESPTVSQTFSTSSDLSSAAPAECTEPPSAEALEDDIKPPSEPEQASGNAPSQPDLSVLHRPSECHASLCFA